MYSLLLAFRTRTASVAYEPFPFIHSRVLTHQKQSQEPSEGESASSFRPGSESEDETSSGEDSPIVLPKSFLEHQGFYRRASGAASTGRQVGRVSAARPGTPRPDGGRVAASAPPASARPSASDFNTGGGASAGASRRRASQPGGGSSAGAPSRRASQPGAGGSSTAAAFSRGGGSSAGASGGRASQPGAGGSATAAAFNRGGGASAGAPSRSASVPGDEATASVFNRGRGGSAAGASSRSSGGGSSAAGAASRREQTSAPPRRSGSGGNTTGRAAGGSSSRPNGTLGTIGRQNLGATHAIDHHLHSTGAKTAVISGDMSGEELFDRIEDINASQPRKAALLGLLLGQVAPGASVSGTSTRMKRIMW